MDNKLLHLSVSPHIHSGRSTSAIMRDVLIALLPATVAGCIIFGWRALLVIATCVLSCVIFEAAFNLITKKKQTIGDLSAAVTGLLLALNLPSKIELWQCVVGSAFAILLVKCIRDTSRQVHFRRNRLQPRKPRDHRKSIYAHRFR